MPEEEGKQESNDFDILSEASRIVEEALKGDTDALSEAEKIAARAEWEQIKTEFGERFADHLEGYSERIEKTAAVLSLPLLEELREIDEKFLQEKRGLMTEDPEAEKELEIERARGRGEVGIKALKIAVSMAEMSTSMYPGVPPKSVFTDNPLDISIFFLRNVSHELGDTYDLTALGWLMLTSGLTGNKIPPEEVLKDSKEYLGKE